MASWAVKVSVTDTVPRCGGTNATVRAVRVLFRTRCRYRNRARSPRPTTHSLVGAPHLGQGGGPAVDVHVTLVRPFGKRGDGYGMGGPLLPRRALWRR